MKVSLTLTLLLIKDIKGSNPNFWTYSSCAENSKSWISTSFNGGAPIKSWIQSIGTIHFNVNLNSSDSISVPTFDDSTVFTQLGSHFVQRAGVLKADLIVQYPERLVQILYKDV